MSGINAAARQALVTYDRQTAIDELPAGGVRVDHSKSIENNLFSVRETAVDMVNSSRAIVAAAQDWQGAGIAAAVPVGLALAAAAISVTTGPARVAKDLSDIGLHAAALGVQNLRRK